LTLAGSDELADVVARARQLEKGAVARLVGMFEDTRPEAVDTRREVTRLLDGMAPKATVVGITGTPGSGKSSLVARLVPALLERDPELTVGVLAVDPSSQVSRGALLGDRTRMRFPADERRCFFRSQATGADLGGLAPASFQVARLMSTLFDLVLVETVGIGQSELDIRHLADHVYLVLQPLGGDEIQWLKAGIVEIPDAFVLNKNDEPAADRTYHQLKSSLMLARPFEDERPQIFRTSATTGDGVAELVDDVLVQVAAPPTTDQRDRDAHFLRRWVREEWGRAGLRVLADEGDDVGTWLEGQGFDDAQAALDEVIASRVSGTRPGD
jgi:LAO/AO transport system kinase